MSETYSWPPAAPLRGARVQLEPLTVAHAREAVDFLDDVRLHRWTGGAPPTGEELERRYRRQTVGHSPDGRQGWLNWMLRRHTDGRLVGTVQATLHRPRPGPVEAELAWVVGHDFQGAGYGKEGAATMACWLRARGVARLVAHVHPEHLASAGIARSLGMQPSGEVHDFEELWTTAPDTGPRHGRRL
ncbi:MULTISPECIES: GNAT family N-acetyltransferase [Streptomyces]|uniref:GNAT family N-acetyltransferase n=1 Tax=Streptomyces TaxID=1883 RepID=UPI000FD9CC2B|nr:MULTISPECIES: GNAT family N-acetyltransferase [unclassified Streptomyces]MCW1093633.1 GNAT family N-acetyltransferase [Streptomyces sp. RS2]